MIQNGQLVRDSYRLDRFHLERLPQLLRDPVATLQSQYGNALLTTADAHAMADKLFPRVMRLLRSLGVTCRYGFDPDDAAFLGDAGALMAHSLIIYVDDPLNGIAAEAGLVLSLSAADQGDLGLVISPFGTIAVQQTAGPWTIGFDLTAGIDVVAWGRNGLTLLASAATTEVTGHLSASLPSVDGGPAFVFGEPDGTQLELGAPQFSAAVDATAARIDVTLSAATGKSALVIHPGDGDGFISSILPSDGMRAEFDLGLAWSNNTGLSLHGGAGLEATLPINRSIGGIITLSSAHLSLLAQDGSVDGRNVAHRQPVDRAGEGRGRSHWPQHGPDVSAERRESRRGRPRFRLQAADRHRPVHRYAGRGDAAAAICSTIRRRVFMPG